MKIQLLLIICLIVLRKYGHGVGIVGLVADNNNTTDLIYTKIRINKTLNEYINLFTYVKCWAIIIWVHTAIHYTELINTIVTIIGKGVGTRKLFTISM